MTGRRPACPLTPLEMDTIGWNGGLPPRNALSVTPGCAMNLPAPTRITCLWPLPIW